MSRSYVRAVDEFCRQTPVHRKELDKPNLHRLIELYEHSIPSFGHAREFMELVFECAHQPLKRCITRSNNRDSHISAVEHCVGNDWQGRLASLYSIISNESDTKSIRCAKRGIRRLLLGRQADLLDEAKDQAYIEETDKMLHNQIGSALQKQLMTVDRIANFGVARSSMWTAKSAISAHELAQTVRMSEEAVSDVVRLSEQWINAVYPSPDIGDERRMKLTLFKGAKRIRVSDRERQLGKPGKFDLVEANFVVQVYLHPQRTDGRLLQNFSGQNAKLCFFAILAVLQREDDHTWAVCQRCDVTSARLQTRQVINSHSFQLLRMINVVRRVAIYHICREQGGPPSTCVVETESHTILHSTSVLHKGPMYFQRRVNGYPPRMA